MKVFAFLAEGFEETEAIYVVDLLRRANIDTKLVSITSEKEVIGTHNIKIFCDNTIDEINFDEGDCIFLPGGMPGTLNLAENDKLVEEIKKYNENKKWLCAICAAPAILGRALVLEGKKATCYPGLEGELLCAKVQGKDVIVSDNVITAPSVSFAEEMGLTMVEKLVGAKARMELEHAIITH